MINRYCVIQYMPDLSDEAINIAVFCFGEDGTRLAATQLWERVECFVGRDIAFIQDFVKELEARRNDGSLNAQLVDVMVSKWHGSFHVVAPRASTQNLDTLFRSACMKYLGYMEETGGERTSHTSV